MRQKTDSNTGPLHNLQKAATGLLAERQETQKQIGKPLRHQLISSHTDCSCLELLGLVGPSAVQVFGIPLSLFLV